MSTTEVQAPCKVCGGSGKVQQFTSAGAPQPIVQCFDCKGTGKTPPPMLNDWKLPADLKAGHATFRKGVHCSALVTRMEFLHEAAFGKDTLTPEQKAENLAALQSGKPMPHHFAHPAPAGDAGALADGLTTCNCRWRGDEQVQQCTLHHAHIDAIHEWAARAKEAEAKLAALAQQPAKEAPASLAKLEPACYIHRDQLEFLKKRGFDDTAAQVRYANGFPSWVPADVRNQYIALFTSPAAPAPQAEEAGDNERFDVVVGEVREWLRTEQGVYLSAPSARKLVLRITDTLSTHSGEKVAPAAITAESLWNNNEVMSLNAELGLTMNQLLKLIRAAVRQD